MNKIAKIGIVFFLVLILLTGNIKAYKRGDYSLYVADYTNYLNELDTKYKEAIVYAVESILYSDESAEAYRNMVKNEGIFYLNNKNEKIKIFEDKTYSNRLMNIINYEVKDFKGEFDSSYVGSHEFENVTMEDYLIRKSNIKKEIYEYICDKIENSDEDYNKALEVERERMENEFAETSTSDNKNLNRYEEWLACKMWCDILNIKDQIEIQEEQELTEEEMEAYKQEFYETIEGKTKEELENMLKGWEQTLEVLAESSDTKKYKKIETWCKLAEAELEKMETLEKAEELAKDQYTSYTKPSREEEESTVHSIDEIIKEGKGFLQKGGEDNIVEDAVINTSNTIYNIFFGIGVVVAVAVGAVIGIKFMVSSVEEKAEIKQILIPYVIGCFIIFGAFGIWKLAMQIVTNLQ